MISLLAALALNFGLVVDSNMTRAEALADNKFPSKSLDRLDLVDVRYFSFDGKVHQGQLVVDRALSREVRELFAAIERRRFPISKAVPIVRYGWNDRVSMKDNNSSGFNYRLIQGSKRLSKHALGRAIDLNPLLNPCLKKPILGTYNPSVPGTLTKSSPIVRLFERRGWHWGGHWRVKDYQHFEK